MPHNQQPHEPIPEPVTAADRLSSIYRSPGPYTSVYLATHPDLTEDDEHTYERWKILRTNLEQQGAQTVAVDAIEARVVLPSPEDTSGIGIIASVDGHTIVDYGLEPPRFDYGIVETLPYASPLLEWQQRRVSHLVAVIDPDGADLAIFGLDHYSRVDNNIPLSGLEDAIVQAANTIRAELVVLAGDPIHTASINDALAQRLPVDSRVVSENIVDDAVDVDLLAEAVTRDVSDIVARRSVAHLRDQRFLESHNAAVEGINDTLTALASGAATQILVHDDPQDQRRLWVGPQPTQLSFEPLQGYAEARLVDAVIRSAVLQEVPVHVIPSTGPTGPDDDTAAIADPGWVPNS